MNAKLEENRSKTFLYRSELKFQKIHNVAPDQTEDKSINRYKNGFGDPKGEPPGKVTKNKVIFMKSKYAKKTKGKPQEWLDSSRDGSWIRNQAFQPQLNDSRDINDVSIKFCAYQQKHFQGGYLQLDSTGTLY